MSTCHLLCQASTRERYHSKAMSGWYATMLAVQVKEQPGPRVLFRWSAVLGLTASEVGLSKRPGAEVDGS